MKIKIDANFMRWTYDMWALQLLAETARETQIKRGKYDKR